MPRIWGWQQPGGDTFRLQRRKTGTPLGTRLADPRPWGAFTPRQRVSSLELQVACRDYWRLDGAEAYACNLESELVRCEQPCVDIPKVRKHDRTPCLRIEPKVVLTIERMREAISLRESPSEHIARVIQALHTLFEFVEKAGRACSC